MAVTVDSALYNCELNDVKRDGYYLQISEGTLCGILEYKGARYRYCATFLPGFKSDGASVPAPFRWFLPSWSESDPKYNAFAKAHDLLYIFGGRLTSGEKWERDECDDFLRGGWRECPTLQNSRFARFRAGTADLLLKIFAGGKKHWGNDSLEVANFGTFNITKLDG